MDRNLTIRMFTILGVLGLCLFLLYPTYRYFSRYRDLPAEELAELSDSERRNVRQTLERSIKLGLDLQGGMHLVFEIDKASLGDGDMRDAQDRVMEILSTRVDQFGVTEPTIARQGDERILVQLPGVDDPERAKGLVGRVAKLQFRMVSEPDQTLRAVQAIDETLSGKPLQAPSDTTAAASLDTTMAGEATPASGDEGEGSQAEIASADTTSTESPLADLPTVGTSPTNPFSALAIAVQNGALVIPDDGYRVSYINQLLQREDVRAAMARATTEPAEFLWSSEEVSRTADGLPARLLYLVNKRLDLSGAQLTDARIGADPDRPGKMLVNFTLSRRGARKFSRLTADNIGKQLCIVLDGIVKSAPSIRSRIPGGEGQISGNFSDDEARDLAIVLRAGALPVGLNIVEERTVGPTLGEDSLNRGLTAAFWGLGITIAFLLVYYQFAGLLASLAVVLNLVIVLAAMATLHAALSLPGIAGLVLAVAMAVDANVLIFERIREELRKAKTVSASVEAGYKNAISAIIDSNLTTMMAGIVLLALGTGPIKGFAVTLCIGITASMFTALFVTRFAFDALTHRRRLGKLSI